VPPLHVEDRWRYLLLAVAPLTGKIRWAGIARMRQTDLLPVLLEWEPVCLIWDGAPRQRGKQGAALDFQRLPVPAYSPALNPAARIFEEIRARTEGVVYASLAAKQAVAAAYRQELAADPERVKQLCGWRWIRDALTGLPPQAA
jgi:hypothetical protein